MVRIEINNHNTYQLVGNLKVLTKLYKSFKIKHPQAFFLRKSGVMPRGWDGHLDYITEGLKFRSGLLPSVCEKLKELGEKVKIIDNTTDFKVKPKMVKQVGNNTPRPYQLQCLKNIIYNKVEGHNFYQGVVDGATNAGKTTIMAMVYLSFRRKIPAIVLVKDGDLFEQLKRELPGLLPKEDLGFVRGKEINFNKFTVVMVQTLSPKVKLYTHHLSKFGIVLVDEADEGGSKTYKNILNQLYNAKVRIGLSGTIYMSKLKKDLKNNMDLKCFFSEVIFKITKREMVDLGYSTDVVVKLWPGSNLPGIKGDYQSEYDINITKNKHRAKVGAELLRKAATKGRLPGLIVYRFHDHGELLYKIYTKHNPRLKIALVHGQTKNRKQILKDFRDGKIDVLIASFIVKRGKNFPLVKYIQNASATDSNETVSQIMGRGERTHESKKRYNLDDFIDTGIYLSRHARHRLRYYKQENFKVIDKR
jgi:superfamily II DNA or RNA helicase